MRRKNGIIALVLLARICTSFQEQTKAGELTKEMLEFTEVFKECYIAQDEVAAVYTDTLEAIEIYVEEPGEEARMETIEILTDASETIQQTEIPACQFSEEIESFLETRGISIAEFEALSAMGEADKQRYLDDLEHYLVYLTEFGNFEDNLPGGLLIEMEYSPRMQRELNEYMFYATNEILVSFEEEEVDYLKEEVIDQLKVYNPEDVKWQDSKEEAFQQQEECWTRIKAIEEELETEAGVFLTE